MKRKNSCKIGKALRQAVAFDVRCGFLQVRKYYIVPFILAIFVCTQFYNYKSYGQETHVCFTFLDYLYRFMEGVPFLEITENTIFKIPGEWFLFYTLLLFSGMIYPKSYVNGMGIQNMVRVRSTKIWWLSKCIWMFEHICLYFSVLYVVIFLFSWKMGSLKPVFTTIDMGLINEGTIKTGILVFGVLPICTIYMINIWQVLISFLSNSLLGMLAGISVLIVSVYLQQELIPGNYLMALRNQSFTIEGVNTMIGISFSIFMSVVGILIGNAVLKKKDFLKKKGDF